MFCKYVQYQQLCDLPGTLNTTFRDYVNKKCHSVCIWFPSKCIYCFNWLCTKIISRRHGWSVQLSSCSFSVLTSQNFWWSNLHPVHVIQGRAKHSYELPLSLFKINMNTRHILSVSTGVVFSFLGVMALSQGLGNLAEGLKHLSLSRVSMTAKGTNTNTWTHKHNTF